MFPREYVYFNQRDPVYSAMQRVALYTTVYPAVECYLRDWYGSVQAQTDQNFELWIGLDQIEPGEVQDAIGACVEAVWVRSKPGSTPAQIREESLRRIVESCGAVVLVDSDDILHPTRVAAARVALQSSELTACALRLVDQDTQDLGRTFTLPRELILDDVLPRNNVFGFSNSAYSSELIRECLPIPAETVLIDWFLATRAWLLGARLGFDPVVRMDYRQHSANTAGFRSPVEAIQVIQNTNRVRNHYLFLQNSPIGNVLPERWEKLQEATRDVELFWERVASQPQILKEYVRRLNTLEPQTIWWWEVARPELQCLWKQHAGERYEVGNN